MRIWRFKTTVMFVSTRKLVLLGVLRSAAMILTARLTSTVILAGPARVRAVRTAYQLVQTTGAKLKKLLSVMAYDLTVEMDQ